MNEAPSHGITSILTTTPSANSYLESDADEQLLLGIAFQQSVKVFALRFTTAESELAKAPKTVRIFSDNLTIGFDEASSQTPAQEFELTREQALGKELVLLRYVKFQKTNSISVSRQKGHLLWATAFHTKLTTSLRSLPDLHRRQPGRRGRDASRQTRDLWFARERYRCHDQSEKHRGAVVESPTQGQQLISRAAAETRSSAPRRLQLLAGY